MWWRVFSSLVFFFLSALFVLVLLVLLTFKLRRFFERPNCAGCSLHDVVLMQSLNGKKQNRSNGECDHRLQMISVNITGAINAFWTEIVSECEPYIHVVKSHAQIAKRK